MRVLPTLADVLELEAVRRGRPQVLAGHSRLGVPVRWVHAIEQTDAARLLHGGELVLSTGIALPDDPDTAGLLRRRPGRGRGERAGRGAGPPLRTGCRTRWSPRPSGTGCR